MFKSLTPNLMVEDVDATIAWYAKVFDAEVTSSVPYTADDSKLQWASIKVGEVELMFQLRASLGHDITSLADAPIASSATLYINVADLDACYARVKEHNATILVDMQTTFYGSREVTIADCNGYILGLSAAA